MMCKRKGTYLVVFAFFLFNRKGAIWDYTVFLSSTLEKVLSAPKFTQLTQRMAPPSWPLHLQLFDFCIDSLIWNISFFICKEWGEPWLLKGQGWVA